MNEQIQDEGLRWDAFLDTLNTTATAAQRQAILSIWYHGHTRYTSVRYPIATRLREGVFRLTWAFADRPDVTLSIAVDHHGRFEWFFRDRARDIIAGNEDWEQELPEHVFKYLEHWNTKTPGDA